MNTIRLHHEKYAHINISKWDINSILTQWDEGGVRESWWKKVKSLSTIHLLSRHVYNSKWMGSNIII